MSAVTTWTRLALAVFSLGGIAGGGYFFKDSLLGKKSSKSKILPDVNSTKASKGPEIKNKNDSDNSPSGALEAKQREDRTDSESSKSELDKALVDSSDSVEASSTGEKSPSSDNDNGSVVSEGDRKEKLQDEAVRGEEHHAQEQSVGENLESSPEAVPIASEVSDLQTLTEDDPKVQDTEFKETTQVSSSGYSFWGNKEKDIELEAEYIISEINYSGDGQKVCTRLSNGNQVDLNSEECQVMVANYWKEEEQEKLKLLVKAEKEENIRKVLGTFDSYGDWTSRKEENQWNSNNLTCRERRENIQGKQEIVVSCSAKGEGMEIN